MTDIYIKVGKDDVVTLMHRVPFDPKHGLGLTKEELLESGFFVREIPKPEQIKGRIAVPRYNRKTKEVYYTYEARPLSVTDRLDSIENLLNESIMNGKL